MKKLLVVLVALCLLQTVWPTLQSFPTAQTRVTAHGHTLLDVKSIDVAKKIGGKDTDIASYNAFSIIQDYSKEIKTSDVTYAFKQSIESTAILQSGGSAWAKTYGGGNDDGAHSIQQTTVGVYIIGRYTSSFGAGDWNFLIIKNLI